MIPKQELKILDLITENKTHSSQVIRYDEDTHYSQSSKHNLERLHTNKKLNKILLKNYFFTSFLDNLLLICEKLYDELIKLFLSFWREHAYDFGYAPDELVLIDLSKKEQLLKIFIPVPLIIDGYIQVREFSFAYVEELFAYHRKKLVRALKEMQPEFPTSRVTCYNIHLLATHLHGHHPPIKKKYGCIHTFRLDFRTLPIILEGMAKSIENHNVAIKEAQKFQTPSIMQVIELNFEFSQLLRKKAEQYRLNVLEFRTKIKEAYERGEIAREEAIQLLRGGLSK